MASGFDKAQLANARRILRQIPEAARAEIEAALDKSADEIAGRARVLAPVDTGELRDAIEVRATLDGFKGRGATGNFAKAFGAAGGGIARFIGIFPARKGAKGWYGAWVEFGTLRNPARPFMRPAFFGGARKARERVARAISKAARRIVQGGGL